MKRVLAIVLLMCSFAAWADEASHRRLAEELMGLTQTEASVRNWRKRYEGQAQDLIDEALQGRRPDQLSDGQRQAVTRFTQRGADALDSSLAWTKLKDPLARLYMDTFTEAETRELVVFYKTPLGQKMLSGLPALSEGIARTVRTQVDAIRPQLQGISKDFQSDFARAVSLPAGAGKSGEPLADKSLPNVVARSPAASTNCRNPRTGQACS